MELRCIACLIAFFAPVVSASAATTTDYVEKVAQTQTGAAADAELEAAQAQARAALPQFLKRLQSKSSTDLEFAVQAKVRRDGLEETLWLTDLKAGKNELSGKLHADPVLLGGLWAGQRLKVELTDVTDWVIVERSLTGERVVGGFTVKLLQEREERGIMPEYLAQDRGVL